ncbi:MAG: Panacea domain-containing protein [Fimbriiglobus sp.]
MFRFQFQFKKSLQAVGVILKAHNGKMERLRLLKLLYIADRELLAEAGCTLTGDQPFAMKHGPVLSKLYDLIKGTAKNEEWDTVIDRDHYQMVLKSDIGYGSLSRCELNKLYEVCSRYENLDTFDLVDITHSFKEWILSYDPSRSTSSPMDWENAMHAQDVGHLIGDVRELLAERELADKLFEG